MTGGRPTQSKHQAITELRDWVLDARCRGVTNPDMWFPSEAEFNGSHQDRIRMQSQWSLISAKAVCSECPVRAECLQWALEHNEQFGVWGGTTVNQRRKILKGTA